MVRPEEPSELWRRLPAPWRYRAPNLSRCKPELKTVPTRCRWPPGSSPSPRSAQKTGAEPPKVLLRRPLRRVKFAQRRLRVFPMGAGGMPPASGRAPPAKRRRGARGNRLPHAEAHLLQLLLQDAAGGHEDRRHGARAARLPGRHDGAALLLPGQHVHRVREARLRPHLGTGEVPPEPCPQDAEQGRCCSGPLMRAGAACRRGRALPPAPGARSPRGDAAGPPSRLRGRAGEFLGDGGQLGGSCAPAASPLLCLCSGGRANECALALRGAGWVAQWPAHTRMMTQGWAGAVGMAAWPAPARRRAALGVGATPACASLGMVHAPPMRILQCSNQKRYATVSQYP